MLYSYKEAATQILLDSLRSLEEYCLIVRTKLRTTISNDHNDINGFNEHESRIRITFLVYHRVLSIQYRVSMPSEQVIYLQADLRAVFVVRVI
jgi:hypothetical protein